MVAPSVTTNSYKLPKNGYKTNKIIKKSSKDSSARASYLRAFKFFREK